MKRIGDDRCTVRDYIELAITLLVAFAIILSGVRVAMVIGPSMQPTLSEYSIHILVPIQDPEIGDIVAFRRPSQKNSYIKRIVAGPGDRVDHWGEMITHRWRYDLGAVGALTWPRRFGHLCLCLLQNLKMNEGGL